MTRGELLGMLIDLAGPLGPFVTLDERVDKHIAFLDGLDGAALDDLLSIHADPASDAALHPYWRPDFVELLFEAIGCAGRAEPERTCAFLEPLLVDPVRRTDAIKALGELGHPRGIAPLADLLATHPLSDEDLRERACSLGLIGTSEAIDVLREMRCRPHVPAVLDEIDLALECTRPRTSQD